MSQPVKIFISYAREDETYKNELLKHLRPLERKGVIKSWHDGTLEAGQEWETELKDELETADVLIFLVSPDFVNSDYINDVEIKKAIERYKIGQVAIVPIWIRPVLASDDFLNKFQALPKDRKPISKWGDKDEAWVDVVTRLNQLFNKLNHTAADQPQVSTEQNESSNENNSAAFSKNLIRDLVGKGKTKDALKILLDYTETLDKDLHNNLTILSSRLSELERNARLGIISTSDQQLERNRINIALLSLLEEIE